MTSLPLCMLLLVVGLTYVAAAKNYVLETTFVVDTEVVKRYKAYGYKGSEVKTQIEKELKINLNDANDYLKTLRKSPVEIRIKNIHFAKSDLFSRRDLRRGNLDIDSDILGRFEGYLTKQRIKGQDMAVLLTGYDLTEGKRTGISGQATFGSACSDTATLVAEMLGYNTDATLAHEIAHTLGASHDGENNCNADGQYIMNPSTRQDSKNRWSFSSCTIKEVSDFIKKLDQSNNNCMLKTTASALRPTKREEDSVNPNTLCNRSHGKGWSMYKGAHSYNGEVKGDNVCRTIYCTKPRQKKLRTIYSPEGLVCDVGKRCRQGKCVKAPKNDPTPKYVQSNCLFGDSKNTKALSNTRGGCSEIIKKEGSFRCYESHFSNLCCESCNKARTNIRGCEYGDKDKFCKKIDKQGGCRPNLQRLCCGTCQNSRG